MKDHYYLDNAATSLPKPEAVYRFMDAFSRSHGVNPGRGGHVLAVEAEQMVFETRRLLAQFFSFSGDPNRVVFTQNATDSLNIALFGLLADGDHVVTTRMEHNSVLRPLNHLERDGGVSVTRVGADGRGYVDPQDIRSAIQPGTRAVVVNHASNVLGSVQDLSVIGGIVADSEAVFIIDSAQTAGVLPIDMEAMHIDVLTFTGHKGLFGPMGVGGLIVREGVNIKPARVGGTGIDSSTRFHPEAYPQHLEAGTVSVPGISGLNAAQKWFAAQGRARSKDESMAHVDACRVMLEHVERTEVAHVRALEDAARSIDGVTVYGPRGAAPRVAALTLNVGELPADQVGEMLDADYHLCVRAGLHCAPLVHEDLGTLPRKGAVRFSPGYFTNEEDIAQAVHGLRELAG